MKKLLLCLFIIGLLPTQKLWGQCNLLQNGGFEQYTTCPTAFSQIHYATNWYDANVYPGEIIYPSSDYVNCSFSTTSANGAPSAHTGTGFASLNVTASSTTESAEMIATCVKLVAGQSYTISMWMYGGDAGSDFYIQGVNSSTFPVPRDSRYCPTTATTLVTIPASDCIGNSWRFKSYTFTSPLDFNAIIIGGVCNGYMYSNNYISFDDISLTSNAPAGYASMTSNVTSVPCGGGNATLTFNLPGQCLGPYNVTYTVNGTPTTLTGINDGHTTTIPITTNSTIVLTDVTNNTGCSFNASGSGSINITAAPGVVADAGQDKTTTCTSPNAILNGAASGGTAPYSYSWSNGVGATQNPTVNPATTTTYTLTVTDNLGCTDTDQVTVTVDKTTPNANAGADINLDCATTSGTFTATGGGTYSWNTPAGTSTGSTVNVTDASATGNYTVTVTGANGCTDTDFAVLSIDQTLPVADAGADQISNCATPTVTLDGTGSSGAGITYAWTGPSITGGGSTSTATADAPGNYTLTVTGSNGCTDTDQVTVNPDNNYPVADAGSDQIIDCNTPSVTLDGSGSDAGATITYAWSTSGGNITGSTSTNTTTSDLDGTYTLTVTNTSNGCASTDNVLVSQDTVTPVASLANSSYVIDCNNPTVTFDASLSTGVGNTFAWTTSDGNIISGANTATPSVDLNGTYNLTITAANGCSNLSSATVTTTMDTVSPTIDIAIADTLTCLITNITLDASNSQTGVTYSWTTADGNILSGANSANPIVDSSGTYLLEVTAANGCTSTMTVDVYSSPLPTTQIIADPVTGEIPLGVNFTNASTGNGLTFDWDLGNEEFDSTSSTTTTYTEVDSYQVYLTVTDQYGCIAIDSITIEALEASTVIIPNVFTPNGDGNNDIFKVSASSIKSLSGQIINRWGQIVYEWETAAGGWDGYSASGTLSAPGTYYYFIVVEFLDGRIEEYKGPLMLQK